MDHAALLRRLPPPVLSHPMLAPRRRPHLRLPIFADEGTQHAPASRLIPRRSLLGLNVANFFQAEMVGVILPVLNAFLKEAKWRDDSIGYATAAAGLGTLLFQTPAGWLTDKLTCRRGLFAAIAILTGACFVALPLVPKTPGWVDSLLFVSGPRKVSSRRCWERWPSDSPVIECSTA